MRQNHARGFTLIEILIVVLIIGLLASVLITSLIHKAEGSKVRITQSLLVQLKHEVQLFKLEKSRYPDGLEDLVRQDYRDEIPRDAWGRILVYRVPGSRGASFDIVSLGEDGLLGGEGLAADLWSHPPR